MEQLPVETMQKAVKGIKYIAHPTRLRILEFLDVNGKSSVSDIVKAIGEEQMIVSQHLKKLREANLVKTTRKGIFIYYDIYEEYPASIFHCIRKLFGYMTNNFYFLQDDYKAILPRDYTTMVANRIKLFAHFDKLRILEYLLVNEKSNVTEISNGTGLEQIKVSQFLKKMKEEEFVTSEKVGRFVYYNITKGVHKSTIQCIHRRYDLLEDKNLF